MTSESTTDFSEQRILDRDMYVGDPHPYFAWLRAQHPVYCDPAGMWALTKHGDIREAERKPLLFSSAHGSRPNVPRQASMIDSDDPWHAAQRRLVAQGFTHRQMQLYEGHVRVVARRLVDDVIDAGTCEVVAAFAKPLPMTLIGEMLGAPASDYTQLQHWSDQMIVGSDDPAYVTDEVVNAAFEYYAYITEVIADRRAQPRDDLVSTLVHSVATHDGSDDQSLADDDIVGNSLLLLVGGNETTRSVITGGIHALLTNPEGMAFALASLQAGTLASTVIEECLRWVTPISNMSRVTTQDVEVRGVTIPQGSQVLMLYIAANRDEDVWANPYLFDATRDPNPHLSFGFGPHLCLGAQLARLELRVIFSEILTRLHNLQLASDDFSPVYGHSSFVRGIQELPITFTR